MQYKAILYKTIQYIEIVNNCILISVFQFYYFKWIKKWRDNEIANQKARKNKNPEL